MTIRHLLTHSSGLVHWTPQTETDALSTAYRAKGITPGHFYLSTLSRPGYGLQANGLVEMGERLAELPLAAEPGTEWRYSVGLDVLGLGRARASGKPLDRFTSDRIFVPLDMASTGFVVPQASQSRLTTNYSVTPAGLVPLDPDEISVVRRPLMLVAGGAGLLSSERDFSCFGAMLASDGKMRGRPLATPETIRQARSNLLPLKVRYEGGGFGAGMNVALGGPSARYAAGAISWNGAAGTMWLVDPARGLILFLIASSCHRRFIRFGPR